MIDDRLQYCLHNRDFAATCVRVTSHYLGYQDNETVVDWYGLVLRPIPSFSVLHLKKLFMLTSQLSIVAPENAIHAERPIPSFLLLHTQFI